MVRFYNRLLASKRGLGFLIPTGLSFFQHQLPDTNVDPTIELPAYLSEFTDLFEPKSFVQIDALWVWQ